MRESESYGKAAKDTNWRAVMEEEMHALVENETWDLVDAPKGVKPIGCRWVYKVKYNTDGSVNRYKARLVAKGYAQQHGIDYDECVGREDDDRPCFARGSSGEGVALTSDGCKECVPAR